MREDKELGVIAGLTVCGRVVLLLVLAVLIVPPLIFMAGYFIGWILMVTCGQVVIDSLNTLLMGRHTFHISELPYIIAGLSLIGSFFKSTSTSTKCR